jgi:hypothetical protein
MRDILLWDIETSAPIRGIYTYYRKLLYLIGIALAVFMPILSAAE